MSEKIFKQKGQNGHEGKKSEGYAMTGFTSQKPVVLVMGGSLGSERINTVVEEALPELLKMAQVVHLTGRPGAERRVPSSYKIFPSLPHEKLPHLYAIADVVVTRAGANSLAELSALGKKMVVIPLGSAASHGDQLANAEVLEREKGAIVIQESELTPRSLLEATNYIL